MIQNRHFQQFFEGKQESNFNKSVLQYDPVCLEATLYVLHVCYLNDSQKGDALEVSRMLTAMVWHKIRFSIL